MYTCMFVFVYVYTYTFDVVCSCTQICVCVKYFSFVCVSIDMYTSKFRTVFCTRVCAHAQDLLATSGYKATLENPVCNMQFCISCVCVYVYVFVCIWSHQRHHYMISEAHPFPYVYAPWIILIGCISIFW